MILIVGLGNPGKKYEHTRHNIGFRIVDAIRTNTYFEGSDWKKQKLFHAALSKSIHAENDILLCKPETFMNESGKTVATIQRAKNLTAAEIIIIHDDIDIDFGMLRIRNGGSSGGHKGLESIIHSLRTDAFWRFRFGVGPKTPAQKPAEDFVLEQFTKDQENALQKAIPIAADAVLQHLSIPAEKTINLLA